MATIKINGIEYAAKNVVITFDLADGQPAPQPSPGPSPAPAPAPVQPYLQLAEGRLFLQLLAADKWRWPFDPSREPPDTVPTWPLQSWNRSAGSPGTVLGTWFQAHQLNLMGDIFNGVNEWAGWNSWGQNHYVTS